MSFTERINGFWRNAAAFGRQNWKRILIWLLAAAVCLYGSYMVEHLSRFNLPWCTTQEFPHTGRWNPKASIPEVVELQPGETLEQLFTAKGNIVGSCSELYLRLSPQAPQDEFTVSVSLWSERKQTVLMETEAVVSELSADGMAAISFPEPVVLKSGEDYRLVVTNAAPEGSLPLETDRSVQSGELTVRGEAVEGVVTYGFLRTSMYTPSILVKCMILLTDATVLIGLALVLFCNVKEHILYLILAVGFGIVTLFDLTPLYGFDMRFQFDSAYVVSNELLGMEGAIQVPSRANPEAMTTGYYRRACDDYSKFQFFREESPSDNYVDMVAEIKDLRVAPEKQELVLAETNQGYVSDQLYILYLPQAIGFAAARLLGLNFLPMVQMGRAAAYALFVGLMFFAIRSVPFGKRVFLILALLPAVLTETVSINRDGVIFGLSFFLVARVLQAAYSDKRPRLWDWLLILAVSLLLAPCKAVYLPISFFCLLAVYRRFIYRQKVNWGRIAAVTVGGFLAVALVMSGAASISISGMLSDFFNPAAAEGATVYNFPYVLNNLSRTFMVLCNTLRVELGEYLLNMIQLYGADLGSSHGVSVLILFLLLVECCKDDEGYRVLGRGERYFGLLVALGVFAATTLAALQWTGVGSYTIFGLQGRYLIPVFPLLCFFLMNNRLIKIQGNTELLVKGCCCIFPAIYLMNMYLWTIST